MGDTFKILFIKPPQGRGIRAIDVPLAFMSLAAYLKHYLREPVDIKLIDLRLTRKPESVLTETLAAFQPDLIGLSLLAEDRNFLNQWSRFLKLKVPKAKTVIGGPAATLEYEELLPTNEAVDWAVIGEGETVFLNLVRALIAGEAVSKLNGLAFVDGKTVVCNPAAGYIEDLDTVPFPDYELVNLSAYFGRWGNSFNGFVCEKRYAPVMSSRGCPFQCIYCHHMFGRKFRKRSPENFVAELQWLYDVYGIREFQIVDDIFNLDRKRMHEILNRIIAGGLKIKLAFPNGLRTDMLEKEDIALLQRAGAYSMAFAIESASPGIQKMIRKNLDIPKVVENIAYAESIGLIVRGFFLTGFPGETVAEIKSTYAFARRSKLDLAFFGIAVPFKGTALARLVETTYPGLTYSVRGDFWDESSFYCLATGYDNRRANVYASLRFYLPFRIFRVLRKLPHKTHIIKLSLDFLRIALKI